MKGNFGSTGMDNAVLFAIGIMLMVVSTCLIAVSLVLMVLVLGGAA